MSAVTLEPNQAVTNRNPGALLALEGLCKSFGSLQALRDVTLAFSAGEVHCLLGENGAGKSTLCNLIFGTHPPDEGIMLFAGREWRPSGPAEALKSGISMVHQHFSLVPRMSVVENFMLGQSDGLLYRRRCADQMREIADRYGFTVDPYATVGELSVGERQRIEIIKCLMREPQLLLLDEPTAVLPPGEVGALLDICRRVARDNRSVILVTHKLAEISRVADRISVLRGGRVVDHAKMPGADLGRLVHSMVGRTVSSLETALSKQSPNVDGPDGTQLRKADVLVCDGISLRDRHGSTRLANVTFDVKAGEIVGIAGVEGNGQSELGMVLAGLQTPDQGRFFVGDTELTSAGPAAVTAAGLGVVPEDRHAVGCITALSVAENMFLNKLGDFTKFGLLRRSALNDAAARLMREFDVRASSAEATFSGLSGGNQQKAVLARELTLEPLTALVAAQPTRGLDVNAVEAVYKAIRRAAQRGVAVLLISSELDELLSVCDRILVIYRGRIVGACPANRDERGRIGELMSGHAV